MSPLSLLFCWLLAPCFLPILLRPHNVSLQPFSFVFHQHIWKDPTSTSTQTCSIFLPAKVMWNITEESGPVMSVRGTQQSSTQWYAMLLLNVLSKYSSTSKFQNLLRSLSLLLKCLLLQDKKHQYQCYPILPAPVLSIAPSTFSTINKHLMTE
jgi:hypothetical protein